MSTDHKTIQWYNENTQAYTVHVKNPKDSIYHAYYEKPAMYQLVPDIGGNQVLSLGCGSGEDSSYLKYLGAGRSVGVDISDGMIQVAKIQHPECEFHTMDMETLTFPDASFDFAYSSLALHYIEDWTQVFQEVSRILKPHSYFLFSFQHPLRSAMAETRSDENGYEKKISIVRDRNRGHIEITGDYLRSAKVEAGGENIMTVTTWHKSLGDIIRTALDSGFVIDNIIEPRPLDELKVVDLETYERLNKIPEFMIIRVQKKS